MGFLSSEEGSPHASHFSSNALQEAVFWAGVTSSIIKASSFSIALTIMQPSEHDYQFEGTKLIYGVPVGLSRTVHYNLYPVPYNRDTTSYMGYEGDDVTSCIASEI